MRIALARLLLSEPDLLLLDEPTNHLDRKARNWVANFVSNYKHTVVVVSHDDELLRTACDSVAEVRRLTIFHHLACVAKSSDLAKLRSHFPHILSTHPHSSRLWNMLSFFLFFSWLLPPNKVSGGGLETYKGMPYEKYLWERRERAKRAVALYSSQVEEATKLQDFINRFGASATKATQAKDREKKLARLKVGLKK
jgi:ATPase subunit of ABC transporter with duplicated ATPase domains